MKGSIVTIGMGQGGVQCSTQIWKLLCMEHGISDAGFVKSYDETSDENIDTFDSEINVCFRESSQGNWRPRALLCDTDGLVIDKIFQGSQKNVFTPDNCITGTEDAANCYARGRYVTGVDILHVARERLRTQVEDCSFGCDAIVSVIATGGGTGAGVLPDLLTLESMKTTTIGMKILPSSNIDNGCSFYNSVLHMNSMNDYIDTNVVFDNENLYKLASPWIKKVTFEHINEIMGHVFCSMTIGNRNCGSQYNLSNMRTNLVPYVGLSYIGCTLAPLYQEPVTNSSVEGLTKSCFEPDNVSSNIDISRGQFLGSFLVCRGKMNQLDLAMVLEQCTKEYRFASWVPAKFSCNSAPKLVDLERISLNHFKFYGESSLCHFFAHTGVIEVFKTQHKWFNTAYEKKCWIHWYTENNMDESEFEESIQALELLQQVYKSVGGKEADEE